MSLSLENPPSELTLDTSDAPLRFITASSLFDGHDASINIMRRILQSHGCEVVHLGHNRSVQEIATAAIQEDADAIAVSSYQGGHVEFFEYLTEVLRAAGAAHIQVFGGGGGVIIPEEIELLARSGVRIYSPQDGQHLGLVGMIEDMIRRVRDVGDKPRLPGSAQAETVLAQAASSPTGVVEDSTLARILSALERDPDAGDAWGASSVDAAVLGITGTGGSGKSSLTDELLRRFALDYDQPPRTAVLAVDPSKRRGGALLGDRIRMNMLPADPAAGLFFRSFATRGVTHPRHLAAAVAACARAGYELVIVETPGIGQGESQISDVVDVSLYVMTPEFGAPSQLEKIDMLDYADAVAVNKCERHGAQDAVRDVARQLQRNRQAFGQDWQSMPVYGTSAASFGDDGVTALYQCLLEQLQEHGLRAPEGRLPRTDVTFSSGSAALIAPERVGYLAQIATTVRDYHAMTERQCAVARDVQALEIAQGLLGASEEVSEQLRGVHQQRAAELHPTVSEQLQQWPQVRQDYSAATFREQMAGRELEHVTHRSTESGTVLPRVALPTSEDHGTLVHYLRGENLPGVFPFTAGTFRFHREGEPPTRMFAGEGDPHRTNARFHLLSAGQSAVRLSTAFDSVTLYGMDPARRPDIYGKVGVSGVSVCTLQDMRDLYAGFDLCAPSTSVSMTINGPAPTILAMFLTVAIEQRQQAFEAEQGRAATLAELAELRADALRRVRGTVQADILKEDQGQNTCIFSTEFSLRCMADIQEWFIEHEVRNFYSASISGYHIAEAGANPISQLAFTLANGFTYVESYLARGLSIDDFAPNLSFFFSAGMDVEYTVLGRVARRIWAVAMRERYGASDRSAKLKYHIQTSGRSLHAQEMNFNDIRTTIQALVALRDNANSLHTNAYDEAVTTPTAESVRRALAIQMILEREWGLSLNENSLQGSYIMEQLTDIVEEAVLAEFEQISARGGVLGAMETGYQRGKIQDESMRYEHRKHSGEIPIIGVNTFLPDEPEAPAAVPLSRGSIAERESQLTRLADFQRQHAERAPAALARVQAAALGGQNVFAALMDAVPHCSLGQITQALFEVGGQFRRNV